MLTINHFQVLVSILSIVDDTKLLSKVGFFWHFDHECCLQLSWIFLNDSLLFSTPIFQNIIRELEGTLPELVLDQVCNSSRSYLGQ